MISCNGAGQGHTFTALVHLPACNVTSCANDTRGSGGSTRQKGQFRPTTACCRSIGDADVKAQGVTALPEVAVHQLAQHDEFVVLASDGLWEKVSNEDMVALIQDTVKQPDMAAKR